MIKFRTLSENELDAWFDHCMFVFNKGVYSSDYRQYFMNHWYNDPWRKIDSILVAEEEGQILSTVRIFHRNIFIENECVRIGGIGEVCTHPEHRGKGLANTLLQQAVQRLEEEDVKISLLFGNKKIYEKLGWSSITRHWKITKLTGEYEYPYKIRNLDIETDISAVRSIHTAYVRELNGPVIRDGEQYWKLWFQQEKKNCSVILSPKGEIVAYGCFIQRDNQLVVEEFCTLPGYDGTFEFFAAYLSSLNEESSCEVQYPAIIRTNVPTERIEENTSAMVRLIQPFSLRGTVINSTQQLVSVMAGDGKPGEISKFFYFGTDGF